MIEPAAVGEPVETRLVGAVAFVPPAPVVARRFPPSPSLPEVVMGRSNLLMSLVAIAALAVGVIVASERANERARPPHREPSIDPVLAARRAGDAASAGPLLVVLLTSDGAEVARARLDGTRAELSTSGLAGVQEENRLSSLGATVEAPAPSVSSLLAPLARPARWEGRHLRLDGSPPARAWLNGGGGLARLEIEVGAGGLLVVTPAS